MCGWGMCGCPCGYKKRKDQKNATSYTWDIRGKREEQILALYSAWTQLSELQQDSKQWHDEHKVWEYESDLRYFGMHSERLVRGICQ